MRIGLEGLLSGDGATDNSTGTELVSDSGDAGNITFSSAVRSSLKCFALGLIELEPSSDFTWHFSGSLKSLRYVWAHEEYLAVATASAFQLFAQRCNCGKVATTLL